MENTVNTTLNISNSDIVTMLIAEKKDQVQKQIDALGHEKFDILIPYIKNIRERLNEFYKTKEFLEFQQSIYNFVKLYNPDIEITVDLSRYNENHFINVLKNNYSLDGKMSFRPDKLEINCHEDDESEIQSPFERDSISYPNHLNHKFELKISKEDIEKHNDIVSQINSLGMSIRNTDKMKEDMIAAMTKQSIMNNPQLLAIRAAVLQISE